MAMSSLAKAFAAVSGNQWAMAATTLLVSLLLLLLRPRSSAHLPPSPPFHLPLLGHFFLLPSIFRTPYLSLRLRFGPIFTLRLGSSRLIFITSPTLAHQALVTDGSHFASRPILPSRALFTSNFRNINGSPYGPYWRAMRRNLVQEMLAPNKHLSFKPARKRILDAMILRLHDDAQSNQGMVAVYSNCYTSMRQLLFFMCLGFHPNDDTLGKINEIVQALQRLQFTKLSDFYPWLRIFEWRKNQRQHILRQMQIEMVSPLIEQHKDLRKVGKVTPGTYLETLLRMNDEGEITLSTSDLVTLCTEFVVAGTDTTVSCMEWTMAHLLKDPAIQSKLYEEIEQVVGSRSVQEEDVGKMRFLQAVVKETLRLHPPGDFLLPHAVTEPCKLGGYSIPADAVINVHVASISRDAEVWEKPLEYMPERFTTKEVDITGSKEVTMIPFGAGRRICPGAGLAMMHVELFVARLVQEFEWTTSKAGDTVDMAAKRRFVVVMRSPLKACVSARRSSTVRNEEEASFKKTRI